MLKNYSFIIKVKYYNEDFSRVESDNALVYADSYKECAEWIEKYYGDLLVSFDVKAIDEAPLFLSDELITAIEKEVED